MSRVIYGAVIITLCAALPGAAAPVPPGIRGTIELQLYGCSSPPNNAPIISGVLVNLLTYSKTPFTANGPVVDISAPPGVYMLRAERGACETGFPVSVFSGVESTMTAFFSPRREVDAGVMDSTTVLPYDVLRVTVRGLSVYRLYIVGSVKGLPVPVAYADEGATYFQVYVRSDIDVVLAGINFTCRQHIQIRDEFSVRAIEFDLRHCPDLRIAPAQTVPSVSLLRGIKGGVDPIPWRLSA